MKRLAVALALLLVAACSAHDHPVDPIVDYPIVDGWPIGEPAVCVRENRCVELLEEALRGLDRRDPDHAAVVDFALHDEGVMFDGGDHHKILNVRSGNCCRVVRFGLADGSVRAIGVGFPGVSDIPIAIDYGP